LIKQGTGTLSFSGSSRDLAYLSIEAGGVTHTSGTSDLGYLLIGSYPSSGSDSDGTFTLTDGTVNISDNNGVVYIGSGNSGENNGLLQIDGGTLNLGLEVDPSVRVDFYGGAFGSTGTATINQTGGTVNKLSTLGVFHIGNQSTGVYNLSGGSINISGDSGMVLGRSGSYGDGYGTLNISGGELTFTEGTDLSLGGAQDTEPMTGSGVVNQTGGLVSLQDGGNLVLGQQGSGTYNLDGGTLEVGGANRIKTGTGTGQFNMGGGTLKMIADTSFASDINPNLKSGTTSTVNTNGYSLTLSGGFTGLGNIVKSGDGTLTLAGVSDHSGSTVVSGGALNVTGTHGGSSLTIDSGAELNGSGTIQAATEINGLLAVGNSAGLMSFEDDLTLGSSSTTDLEFFANSSSDRGTNFDAIDVSGLITIEAGATINLIFNGEGSTVDFTDVFWASSQTWLIIDGAANSSISSEITFNVSQDSLGQSLNSEIGEFSFQVNGNDFELIFAPVPEPAQFAAVLSVFSLALAACRRRRVS